MSASLNDRCPKATHRAFRRLQSSTLGKTPISVSPWRLVGIPSTAGHMYVELSDRLALQRCIKLFIDFSAALLMLLDMSGMMLYELHAPLMCMARNEYRAGAITQEQLKERLQEPVKCLEDAARILLREDPHSPEGITGLIASQSLAQLKASLDSL